MDGMVKNAELPPPFIAFGSAKLVFLRLITLATRCKKLLNEFIKALNNLVNTFRGFGASDNPNSAASQ